MLTVQSTEAIRRIEAAIGYTFKDKRLLVQVFTRKTYMKIDPEAPDNEVLEFYGDMLMSYHVTTYFVEKFAHMLNDGLYFMRTVEQFTEMRSHYVRNQYLTERIKDMIPGIERLIRAQNPRAELPKDNQKAYADLFESLIGAVYLDSYQDDRLIRAFILRHLNIEPKAEPSAPARGRGTVTVLPAVSLFDADSADTEPDADVPAEAEEAPAALPDESVDAVEEPAAPEIPAELPTEALPTRTSRRKHAGGKTRPTEEAALPVLPIESPAAEAVDPLPAELPEPPLPTTKRDELMAFCLTAGYESPVFGEPPKNAPNARPVAACTITLPPLPTAKGSKAARPVKISLNDSGKTLAEAEEKVAAKMLKKLMERREDEEKAEASAPAEAVTEAVTEVAPETVTEPVTEPAPIEKIPVTEPPTEPTPTEEPSVEEAPAVMTLPAEPAPEAPAEVSAEAPSEAPAKPKRAARAKKKAAETAEASPMETAVEAAVEVSLAEAAEAAEIAAPTEIAPTEAAPAEKTKRPARTRKKAAEALPAEVPAEVPAEAPAEAPTELPAETTAEALAETPAKPKRPSRAKKPKADAADEA